MPALNASPTSGPGAARTTVRRRPTRRGRREVAGPFLKWAGGKGQLLAQFAPLYPPEVRRYVEPFVGSAAVFFDLRNRHPEIDATLSDNNPDLIGCFEAVRDDVLSLIHI